VVSPFLLYGFSGSQLFSHSIGISPAWQHPCQKVEGILAFQKKIIFFQEKSENPKLGYIPVRKGMTPSEREVQEDA